MSARAWYVFIKRSAALRVQWCARQERASAAFSHSGLGGLLALLPLCASALSAAVKLSAWPMLNERGETMAIIVQKWVRV